MEFVLLQMVPITRGQIPARLLALLYGYSLSLIHIYVTQLHRNLFKEDSYEPSEKVTQINDDIIYLTGVTEDTDAMNTTFEGDISNEGAQ